MRPYRLFFSHGGDDTYIVENFLKPKVESSGASVFLDAGQIQYGDDFRQMILAELMQCEELLVLFTKSSLRRPWVLAEVGATLIRSKRIVAITYGPSAAGSRWLIWLVAVLSAIVSALVTWFAIR